MSDQFTSREQRRKASQENNKKQKKKRQKEKQVYLKKYFYPFTRDRFICLYCRSHQLLRFW